MRVTFPWRVACVFALISLPAMVLAAAQIQDVRLWRAPDHTRIVFDLDGPVTHNLMLLESPRRIVIDIADAKLAASTAGLELNDTPIRSIRTGIREGTDLRVVLDMAAEVKPRSFPLAATERTGDRLVIDLYDLKTGGAGVRKSDRRNERRDIVVAIDAGHGGEDPGALGPRGLQEKDVVLAIARRLHALLKEETGFEPHLIRTGDYYISLRGRRERAREQQADLFVSIHADGFHRPEAYGASIYALSLSGATSTTARYLAQRENAADLVGGVRLADKDDVLASVLADLSMTSTLDTSLNLGAVILERMGRIARLHKKQVEQAGFAVLKSPDIPSVLVETGFISNPGESRKLSSADYQQRMAAALRAGIREWFLSHPPSGTLIAWRKQNGPQQYVIERGDTLSGIAQRFNVPLADLKRHNGLQGSRIMVGQTLLIPRT